MTKLLLFSIISCICLHSSASSSENKFWQLTSGPANAFTFAVNPNGNIFAGTSNGSVYRSTDHGTNWTQCATHISSNVHSIAIDTAGTIYCATEDGLFRSVDSGTGWWTPNANLNGQPILSVATSGNTIVIGLEFGGTYRSTDKGLNWASSNEGFPQDAVNMFASDQNFIYAGMYSSGIYRSSDNGASWVRMSTGLPYNAHISALSVAPNGNVYAGLFTEVVNNSADTQGVYQSVDHGATWTKLSGAVDTIFITSVTSSNGNIFVADQYNVYHSTDNGASWTSDTSGLMGATVYGFGIDSEGYVFAGTANGIFRSTSSTPVNEPPTQTLLTTMLGQNYPNPFNASTSVELTIPQTGSVSLGVYDVLGNEVKHVFTGELESGKHQMSVYANGLPNGVYYYKLQAGGVTETRSMLLVH
jgi:ligand-binding sensor domain-containing protein